MTNIETTKKTNHHSFYFKVLVVLVGQVLAAMVVLATVGLDPAEAAYPGANGKIAFQSNLDGNPEIFTMNPDGTDQKQLTFNTAADEHPAVSPDGRIIAFTSDRAGDRDIWVMNSDGSGVPLLLTTSVAADFDPAFSPDGKKIAFLSNRGNTVPNDFDIFVMDAAPESATNQPRRLTSSTAFDAAPTWSPDGTQIAYQSNEGGNFNVWVLSLNGSAARHPLTSSSNFEGFPNYSPNGKKIAFTSDRDGNFNVYKMNLDGTSQKRLTKNTADDMYPAYSPDGRRITFASSRDGTFDIYRMNAKDGTRQKGLTGNTADNAAEDFFPDWGVVTLQ